MGNRKEYELLGHATTTFRLGHQFQHGGWGILGGGAPSKINGTINAGTHRERALKPLETVRMEPGDTFMVEMPGGGGLGNPRARAAEAVLEDVLNGYVSRDAAERDYGVSIDPATMTIDREKTSALRRT